MSRLLFAAARGARIEQEVYDWTAENGKLWTTVPQVRVVDDSFHYRIHPDDAHLQYGPISTALRKDAEDPPENVTQLGAVNRHYTLLYKDRDYEYYMGSDDLHRSTYLLFVAEALADEGM